MSVTRPLHDRYTCTRGESGDEHSGDEESGDGAAAGEDADDAMNADECR